MFNQLKSLHRGSVRHLGDVDSDGFITILSCLAKAAALIACLSLIAAGYFLFRL